VGHKVHPTGFRLGVIRGWDSRWYANRNYKDLLAEDQRLRKLIQTRLANAAVARIEIERVAGTQLAVTIHTAKPGIVIGKSGESVERLRQLLERETKKKVRLTILEIRNPEVEAVLVARNIAEQLEKRISFRRAMKQAVQKAMRGNVKGIKVLVGGRLGGAEIARSEKEVEGSVPLQTLRANIDYGQAEAHTTFGVVGVKVWIYKGDVLPERQRESGFFAQQAAAVPAGPGDERPARSGERAPRGGGRFAGGERGGRGAGERGGRTASGPGGERRPPRPRTGAPSGAPGRPAPAEGATAPRARRTGESEAPATQAPAAEVTPEAGATGSTAAESRGAEAQAPAQMQPTPEETSATSATSAPETPRTEEESGS
jgi:small subunit ribosomal protein S3